MGTLVLRADATVPMGTGHVMRCLALAQAWQEQGGRAVLAAAEVPPGLAARCAGEGLVIEPVAAPPGGREDAAATARLASRVGARLLVVDGYQLGAEFHAALDTAGPPTLMIDDCGIAWRPAARWVLNQNVQAHESLYPARAPETRLLLGCRYALLRREFTACCGYQRQYPEVASRVLVTLGGSDSDNVTSALLGALAAAGPRHLEYRVVVGAANPHLPAIRRAAHDGGLRAEVLADVRDMPGLMAWADVAVSAGGSTCWELAMMGLPSLVIVLADNQRPAVEWLDRQGVIRGYPGPSPAGLGALAHALSELCRDGAGRRRMGERGQQLVDGRGALRTLGQVHGASLELRAARPDDARPLWQWANQPEVRAASFSTRPIPWDEHLAWFAAKLRDARCLFLLAQNQAGGPVGLVRFDIKDGEAVVSVIVDRACRGLGYGRQIIEGGTRELFAGRDVARVHAYIRPTNAASLRAFEAAGYTKAADTLVQGQPASHLVKSR